MNPDTRLYELLPALYRLRDAALAASSLSAPELEALEAKGLTPDAVVHGPLKSLMAILADQMAVVEENLDQLYDDQFIETCAEWVVPYIGKLIGSRDLIPIPDTTMSMRAEVANTISYRRRKGTASIIEQLARDVTGWDANVVEFFERLATTQYMNHLRPHNLSFTEVRYHEPLSFVGSPFDRTARTADVRHISNGRGKYNIPNIGIFLWRLKNYSIGQCPAFKVDDLRYTFDRLGASRSLFTNAIAEDEITQLAGRLNVPTPLNRRLVSKHLSEYYGPGKSIMLYQDGALVIGDDTPGNTLQDLISMCDLSDVKDSSGTVTGWAHMPAAGGKIAIDPELGRIAFPPDKIPGAVETEYHYAFSAEMGGGGYEREQTFTPKPQAIVRVPAEKATIQEAIDEVMIQLNANTELHTGVVEIEDNRVYTETLNINLKAGKTLEIRASDKKRPIICTNSPGSISIVAETDASLIFNGILIKNLSIKNDAASPLKALSLRHCTVLPRVSSPDPGRFLHAIEVNSPATEVSIDKSIVSAVRIQENARMFVTDSIIDAGKPEWVAVSADGNDTAAAVMHIENSTIIGKVHTRIMEYASNCIFYAQRVDTTDPWVHPVKAQRLQNGCARFSWFPSGSRIPAPYKCQPASALDADRIVPMFNSTQYGDPDYLQISQLCAPEIRRGAEDGSEMGAFHQRYTPQRLANLNTRLEEYLRFGMEAGVFFAS